MKRILWLTAAALLCCLCMISASAAGTAAPDDGSAPSSAVETVQDTEEVKADGINLTATTTAIIIVCSALSVGVICFAVKLGMKNRSKPDSSK